MRGLDHKGPRAVQCSHAQGGDGVNPPNSKSLAVEVGERIAELCASAERLQHAREFAKTSLDAAVAQQRKNAGRASVGRDPIIETIEDFRLLVDSGARWIASTARGAELLEELALDPRNHDLRRNPRRAQLAMSSLTLGLRRSIAQAPEASEEGLDTIALATLGMTVVFGEATDAAPPTAPVIAITRAEAKRERKRARNLAERNR